VSVNYPLRGIVNVSRPGQPPRKGDTVEVETVSGFVRRVNPATRECEDARQQFVVMDDAGTLGMRH
jgi:hypothetical protein